MGSRIAAGPAIPELCGWITGERRLTTLLAPLILAEALETTRFHRGDGRTGDRTALVMARPFRALHHTISDVGLIGGGQVPMPGEVSLAHHGIVFLDELPEFKRHVLEVLRQPLEEGMVIISLASMFAVYLICPTLPIHL
jgi:magnesium chelatase family protein